MSEQFVTKEHAVNLKKKKWLVHLISCLVT